MSMTAWQHLAARVSRRSNFLTWPFRLHHTLPVSPHSCSSMSAAGPILFPQIAYPGEEIPDSSIAAPGMLQCRIPFLQLMAVPKRKVSPSRKGKRNGPKALKPVPVVAKCKVCGRIKLPHFYCCSGEAKVEEI